jgi:hypothetical protein
MRPVILVLLFFTSLLSNAQSSLNLSFGVSIRIACGFVGETSTEVSSIQQLVSSKNYNLIRKKLNEGNKTEALLSTIALIELQSKQRLELTPDEQSRINEIVSWKDEYTVCYTCTQHFKGTVSQLLQNKSSLVYLLLKQTIIKEE